MTCQSITSREPAAGPDRFLHGVAPSALRIAGAAGLLALMAGLAGCNREPAPGTPTPASSPSPAAVPAAPAAAVRHVNADAAAAWLREHPDTVVLDVRTPEEWAEQHIAGSTLIDFQAESFAEKVAALDKSKTYLLHCASGRRSGLAQKVLVDAGLSDVLHLDGGIQGWVAAGNPVVAGP